MTVANPFMRNGALVGFDKTDALWIAGAVVVSGGVGCIYYPAGIITFGVFMIVFALMMGKAKG